MKTAWTPEEGNKNDDEYAGYLKRLNARVAGLIASGKKLFLTDVSQADLWEAYIEGFSGEDRQEHNCRCCKTFIERYGSAVYIQEDGTVKSAMWDPSEAPGRYTLPVQRLQALAETGKVTDALVSSMSLLGQSETGVWSHFHLTLPKAYLHPMNGKLNADQRAAEIKEDVKNVKRALAEFRLPNLGKALVLLQQDALYRAEKVLGPVQWLHDLQLAVALFKGKRADNLIWDAVASAPPAFCHPRSSMAGTLLEDLEKGLPFETVKKSFAAKMKPDAYQRPQAAPTEGNIKRGEEIIEKLGVARSLERRFARLEEVQLIWKPTAADLPAAPGGVFGHLKAKGAEPVQPLKIPSVNISFEKFCKTVLDKATKLEVFVHPTAAFFGVLTAEHEDAPPILQWDEKESRNPFSWYTYSGGSRASQWGMKDGRYAEVSGVMLQPTLWAGDKYAHQGKGAVFIVEGCQDSLESGNALFPECLISDLREIRSTIEAYSSEAKVGGREKASANGLGMTDSGKSRRDVRATIGGQVFGYMIDRWD